MPKKNSHITVTDQFCGAGGSSQGVRALAQQYGSGIEIKLALNHWKLAIETHNTNFPDTLHDCTDISAADPRRYPSTDILITSPECTNHSLAKGQKIVQKQIDLFSHGELDPAAERSRATMWDVPRFAEFHGYNCIIVENVVDARKWIMFDAWLMAMHSLGYLHKCCYLNSMHFHPTPQSRDRMYIVFWKKGNKAPDLEYLPLAWCEKCSKNVQSVQTWKNHRKQFGKYRQQYVYCCPSCASTVEPYYYASFNCIDWTDIGERIGDRAKALSPKTITRISYGLDKYGKQPMVVVNYSPGYCKPVTDGLGTVTAQDHHGFFTPYIVNRLHGSHPRMGPLVKSSVDPLSTQPTLLGHGIVVPFIVKLEHGGKVKSTKDALHTQTTRQSDMVVSAYVKSSSESLPTQTTCQGMGFVVPMLTDMHANGMARPTTEAMSTITAGGVKNGLITTESWNSFIASYYNGSHCTKHITEESGTMTTGDRMGLVNFKEPILEDCHYRMLKAPEVKLGMAFDKDYIVLGNSREQVKQCGNAVTPPAMKWLAEQVIKSLS
jgi:DNA (cytosine-5)-methyltransferase 1